MKINKLFVLLISLLLTSCNGNNLSQASINHDLLNYGEYYKVENETVNNEYLAGMCYMEYEWNNQLNDDNVLLAMKNLGVKSLRMWMHFSYFMENPTTLNQEKVDKMHEYLKKAIDMNFQIIGMNHYSYHHEGYFSIGKERRIDFENPSSKYSIWLDDYETSWYTLANEFKEITYWEIDNELDNPDFMYIDGAKNDVLNQTEMAHISLDMLYRGSIGIHKANKANNTIMGGLVDSNGLGKGSSYNNVYTGNNKEFLEIFYDLIDSGEHGSIYYDDFFQIAAWHPYYYQGTADDYFVSENNKIYEIIKRREGKDKKVFLTEFGWTDLAVLDKSQNIIDLYTTLKEKMPYVESLHYFLLFDKFFENNVGLFDSPLSKDASPKSSAYAYQKVNNGSGKLDFIFRSIENEKNN